MFPPLSADRFSDEPKASGDFVGSEIARLGKKRPSLKTLFSLIEFSGTPVMVTRLHDGQVLYANEAMGELAQTTSAELVGQLAPNLYQRAEDRQQLLEKLEAEGRFRNYRIDVRGLQGREFTVLCNAERIDLFGEEAILNTYVDISEVQRELFRQQQFHLLAASFLGIGYGVYDVQSGQMTIDESVREMLELGAEEVFSVEHFLERMPEANREFASRRIEQTLERLMSGKFAREQYLLHLPSGTQRIIRISSLPVEDTEPWIVHFFQDITDREFTRRKARQKDRLASLGQFTAEIVHDLRSPLATLSLNTEALYRLARQASPTKAQWLYENSQQSVQRAAKLLNRTLEQTRQGENMASVKLSAEVDRVLEFLQTFLMKRHIPIQRHLENITEAEEPELQVNPVLLQQCLQNLITNAVQATIPVINSGTAPEKAPIDLVLTLKKGFMKLEVLDCGVGIEEQDLPHIFDEFYTTRSDGNGIGLPLSRRIAEEHGGYLEALNRADRTGARLVLQLPID